MNPDCIGSCSRCHSLVSLRGARVSHECKTQINELAYWWGVPAGTIVECAVDVYYKRQRPRGRRPKPLPGRPGT
jgi:hypothetical protein